MATLWLAHAQDATSIKADGSGSDPVVKVIAQTSLAPQQIDPHQKTWSRTTWESNSVSGEVIARTNSYTEIATGNAYLSNGQWSPASDQIEITKTGARAVNALMKVQFLGNINSIGAVDLTLPEGDKHLVSSIVGLSFEDLATGKSVLIAELKDSVGQLLPSGNQVLYPDAFTDFESDSVKASVLYVNSISSFEQLILITHQLPSPQEWGLDPQTTVLQVITEFYNAPEPLITEARVGDMLDEHLNFGMVQMPRGTAFALGDEAKPIPVTKHWRLLDGNRRCLIEQTPFLELAPMLLKLPASAPGHAALQRSRDGFLHRVAGTHLLPPRNLAQNKNRPLEIATSDILTKAVAIDYTALVTQTNLILQGDTTYYLSGNVNISGTLTIEGNTVVKMTNTSPASIIASNVVWSTSSYRPAIFTSKNDDSVGESIGGSTSNPGTNFCGGIALDMSGGAGDTTVSNARFSYISNAVAGVNGYGITFKNVQFNQCSTIISPNDKACYFRNCLFYNIGTIQYVNCGSVATAQLYTWKMLRCTPAQISVHLLARLGEQCG